MKTRLTMICHPTSTPLLSFLAPSTRAPHPIHVIRRTLYKHADYTGAPPSHPEATQLSKDQASSSPPPPNPGRSSIDLAEQPRPGRRLSPSEQIKSGGLLNPDQTRSGGLFSLSERHRARTRLPRPAYPISEALKGNSNTPSTTSTSNNPYASDDVDQTTLSVLSRTLSSQSLAPKHELPEPNLRLGPSLGRSVAIDPNRRMDLARAIKAMERQCRSNNVRLDEKAQLFHVRRGQMRKTLKSKRWRVRFKRSFQGAVSTVLKMKRQGW